MNFIKNNKNPSPLIDTVFTIVEKAKDAKNIYGDEVIDATIGSLFNESSELVTLDCVYSTFTNLNPKLHAKYAQTFSGNKDYKESIEEFVLEGLIKVPHHIFATPGGTGAVSSTIANLANANEYILLPEIAWSSYFLMAKEFNLNAITYPLFKDYRFDLETLKNLVLDIFAKQDQVIIVINDPCHNPTGYSMSIDEWQELIAFFNSLPKNKRVVILNDIAYIDYSYSKTNKEYFKLLNNLNENILTVIAYSCSKSFSSYGLRLGAAIIVNKEENNVKNVFEAFEKTARSIWSNVNNGAMETISYLLKQNKEKYLIEKEKYIDLLRKRSNIFIKEAESVNLEHYPYKEGFFITLKIDENKIDEIHEKLMENNIFTVKVNKGIRIAICSLPIHKCYGLAKKIKELL